MTDKLKPCPFCKKSLAINGELARCETSGCWMSESLTAIPVDSPKIITHWNTRAADALEPSGDVVERVARAIAIAMFGYDCIPHDTELCRASESRVGTVMRAAQAALGACHAE